MFIFSPSVIHHDNIWHFGLQRYSKTIGLLEFLSEFYSIVRCHDAQFVVKYIWYFFEYRLWQDYVAKFVAIKQLFRLTSMFELSALAYPFPHPSSYLRWTQGMVFVMSFQGICDAEVFESTGISPRSFKCLRSTHRHIGMVSCDISVIHGASLRPSCESMHVSLSIQADDHWQCAWRKVSVGTHSNNSVSGY